MIRYQLVMLERGKVRPGIDDLETLQQELNFLCF
jgi:hypothetical protein